MTRISQTGYNPQSVGEIIALGYSTPASVVAGWMRSSGHRANILNSTRLDIGCDYLNLRGRWWTCDFGKSYGGSGGSVPIPTVIPSSTTSPTPSLRPSISPSPSVKPVLIPPPASSIAPWWCDRLPTHYLCS